MAMALIPLAVAAAKTAYDSYQSGKNDDAQRAAAAQKMAVMRQGAVDTGLYREALQPQMLTAMHNEMGAYAPVQNVLSQMYGGHQAPPMGRPMNPNAGSFSGAGPVMNGPPQPPPGYARPMGFGGEMPMPADLAGGRR